MSSLRSHFDRECTKLLADAGFNQGITHAPTKGHENEKALYKLLRRFLPPRFGMEQNAFVIDRNGHESKECDIVIFESNAFPRYFSTTFPVELVHCVVEVKTTLSSSEAADAIEKIASVTALAFEPALTNYWVTRSAEEGLTAEQPIGAVFAFRSNTDNFETFRGWHPTGDLNNRIRVAACLDQGTIRDDGEGYIAHRLHVLHDTDTRDAPTTSAIGKDWRIDQTQVLFWFLEQLWWRLVERKVHPGFDIRAYAAESLDNAIEVD